MSHINTEFWLDESAAIKMVMTHILDKDSLFHDETTMTASSETPNDSFRLHKQAVDSNNQSKTLIIHLRTWCNTLKKRMTSQKDWGEL